MELEFRGLTIDLKGKKRNEENEVEVQELQITIEDLLISFGIWACNDKSAGLPDLDCVYIDNVDISRFGGVTLEEYGLTSELLRHFITKHLKSNIQDLFDWYYHTLNKPERNK